MLWTVAAAGRLEPRGDASPPGRAEAGGAAAPPPGAPEGLLPFWLSIGVLSLVQALLVAAPEAPSRPCCAACAATGGRWSCRSRSSSSSRRSRSNRPAPASSPTWRWSPCRRWRPRRSPGSSAAPGRALALLVLPLFAIAWAAEGALSGETAALALSALACVSLGWLVACVVPPRWLKLGIYVMAAIDAWLVGTNLLQEPNSVLNAAAPAADLPRLQFASFGSAVMGFGDLFIAATLGALLASDRRLQLQGAVLAAVICPAFDLLFFCVDQTPATVPIALTLAASELLQRHQTQPHL